MARDHARIYVSIWSDPEFRALPVAGQHAYFVALSQARLSYCGVLDYLPTRLAKLTAKATPRTVANAFALLQAHDFAVMDEETGELLVRSFVRHDGLLSSPNMTKAMAKDYEAVLSDDLRAVVEQELARAKAEGPDLAAWKTLRQAFPELLDRVEAKGSRKGSANG